MKYIATIESKNGDRTEIEVDAPNLAMAMTAAAAMVHDDPNKTVVGVRQGELGAAG